MMISSQFEQAIRSQYRGVRLAQITKDGRFIVEVRSNKTAVSVAKDLMRIGLKVVVNSPEASNPYDNGTFYIVGKK